MKYVLGNNVNMIAGLYALGKKEYEFDKDEHYELWSFTDSEFDKLVKVTKEIKDTLKDMNCWWTENGTSNLEEEINVITIKGNKINAWYNKDDYYNTDNIEIKSFTKEYFPFLKLTDEEIEKIKQECRELSHNYKDLFDYLLYHMGAGKECNKIRLAMRLAELNNMNVVELFKKYQ